jgi:hypothetical protein
MKTAMILHVLLASVAAAQTCITPTPRFTAQMETGWVSTLLVDGFKDPRAMVVDQVGNMLVVEQGGGVKQIKFMEQACNYVCAISVKDVLKDSTVSDTVLFGLETTG